MKLHSDWIYQLYINEMFMKNKDYYWEKGNMVMTEKYHLERGNCCKSGCRHCPYKNKD